MDHIGNSHMKRIAIFLEEHPEHVFKARKYPDHWCLWIAHYDGAVKFQFTGNTFGDTATSLSTELFKYEQSMLGVNSNERNSES